MTETDFKCCTFIKEELCFFNLYEFYKNRKIIKHFYEGLDRDAKQFYKWYVYANIFMSEKEKDIIWRYLNEIEIEYEIELTEQAKKYMKK